MLGLANLGGGLDGFVGAFYPVATNIIVVNSLPLANIRQTDPALAQGRILSAVTRLILPWARSRGQSTV